MSGQLKYSEALTTRVVLKGGVPRTYSGFIGQMIISAVEEGATVRLIDVPISKLYTGGSSGSNTRQHYFMPAIEEIGVNSVYEKLPPVILREDPKAREFYNPADKSSGGEVYETLDGNTRIMVAAQQGMKTIRAYVIPAETTISSETIGIA